MEHSKNISGESQSLGSYFNLSQTFLEIPKFQRSYAWKDEHVQQWLNDIESINKDKEEYFIGSLIYEPQKNMETKVAKLIVFDGQQRLTTTFLIYHLMICIYKDKKLDNDDFDENILHKIKFSKSGKKYLRIKLNKYDNDYFTEMINGENPEATKTSHENLNKAYIKIKKWLNDGLNKNGIDFFLNIHETFSEYFTIMGISVASKIDAYKLFESMNDKGLKLSQTDLVKNYIFQRCENHHDEIEKKWEEIHNNIKSSDYDFDVFAQYYWDGEYKEIRKNEVYKKFTESLKTESKVFAEVEKIKEASKHLDMFINPIDYEWGTDKKTFKKILKVISEIKSFGLKQVHILIIQLLKFANYDEENEIDQSKEYVLPYLIELRNFTFIYSVVCKKSTNAVLPRLIKCALYMNTNDDPTTDKFIEVFDSIKPKKEEYDINFLKFNSDPKVSKEILKSLFPAPNGFDYDSALTELEHILPQKWDSDKDWNKHIKDELNNFNHGKGESDKKTLEIYVQDLLHCIGNHVLLFKEDNISVGNKFFNKKFIDYDRKSSFAETKSISSNYDNWNHESIYDRAKKLNTKIVNKWNLFN